MRYVVWALRLLVFVVVLMFALKNTGPVTVNFFGDYQAEVGLIVVMLATFVIGAFLGLLMTLPAGVRRRREVARQRRELERLRTEAAQLREAAERHAGVPAGHESGRPVTL
ncbi:MAG: lipopolysaccharide assembly LapA domain-containing protein [Pigmentiphaga sp.]